MKTMKNFVYLSLVLLLFNCGPDESLPIEQPTIITDQVVSIELHYIGDVYPNVFEENLSAIVTNDSLFVDAEDESFKMILSVDEIVDGIVSPSLLKFTSTGFSSGPTGPAMDCKFYPCENYSISFTEMDFSQFGILEGSIYGAHESNPEEVQVFGSFKLQIQ